MERYGTVGNNTNYSQGIEKNSGPAVKKAMYNGSTHNRQMVLVRSSEEVGLPSATILPRQAFPNRTTRTQTFGSKHREALQRRYEASNCRYELNYVLLSSDDGG